MKSVVLFSFIPWRIMFKLLGKTVAVLWPMLLVGWLLLLGVTWWYAPEWEAVTESTEMAALPEDSPSFQGERRFKEAFPGESTGSTIVLVASRADAELQAEDKRFIKDVLVPRVRDTEPGEGGRNVTHIRSFADQGSGALLVSRDKHATLVVMELATQFLDSRNAPLVAKIEELVATLRDEGEAPEGLEVAVTGSATAGRDMQRAEAQSAHAVEIWTVGVVVVLLMLMYRAPFVALIPLLTVFISVQIALHVLAMLAEAEVFTVFRDVRVFINVLAYGAGVDYCMFLIARYQEERNGGADPATAVATAVGQVGGAITASAATVIGGIAMLAFARFGKIHDAGITIPLALVIVLCAALAFTASLLRLAGRWVFWPRSETPAARAADARRSRLRVLGGHWMPDVWEAMGRPLLRWPGFVWLASVAIMAPFAVVAVVRYDDQNFNPISELPDSAPSVAGLHVVEEHFPLGMLGPVTVLLQNDEVDFGDEKGSELVSDLTGQLREQKDELDIVDVRGVTRPLGITPAAKKAVAGLPRGIEGVQAAIQQLNSLSQPLFGESTPVNPRPQTPTPLAFPSVESIIHGQAVRHYVSQAPAGRATPPAST
jgi:RND superfamily putative drug exporter